MKAISKLLLVLALIFAQALPTYAQSGYPARPGSPKGVRSGIVSFNPLTTAPINTAAPVISGTVGEGKMLTATDGTWANSPYMFYRQWYLDGVALTNEVTANHIQSYADVGHVLTYTVATRNNSGISGLALSSNSYTPTGAAAFSPSQFPTGALLDNDAAVGVLSTSNRIYEWDAAIGTATFTQATAGFQPLYVATGWDGSTLPIIRFDGTTSAARQLASNETEFDHWADVFVIRRSVAAQPATATNKSVYGTVSKTAMLGTSSYVLRATNDSTQCTITTGGLGGGSTITLTHLCEGQPTIYSSYINASNILNVTLNGGTYSTSSTSTTTSTGSTGFGSTNAANGGTFDLARRFKLNMDAIRGTYEQTAPIKVLEGYLACKYNQASADLVSGTANLVSALPSTHTYKNRCPDAADYNNQSIVWQSWGDSLTNGWSPQAQSLMGTVNLGTTYTNGGVGGDTACMIYNRFEAATATVKARDTEIGDVYVNGIGTGCAFTTPRQVVDAMVSEVEAAQGVTAGNGRIIVTDDYRTNSKPLAPGTTDSIDTEDASLRAAYPNYYLDMYNLEWMASAPDGASPDTTAFSNRQIPTPWQADATHPNTNGYVYYGQIIVNFIHARGWDRL